MRRRQAEAPDIDFWPGFTDVLAGMLLAMVFVLTCFAVAQTGLAHLVGNKDSALARLQAQTEKLEQLLLATNTRAGKIQRELLDATAQIVAASDRERQLRADIGGANAILDAEKARVANLVAQLEEYNKRIADLSAQLAGAQNEGEQQGVTISDLNAAINRLRSQLAGLSTELTAAEAAAGDQRVRLSSLLVEMAKKDRRIAELEPLAAYRSEFLQKMSEVFADNPNITVVGDRFIFQSEVLFSSGQSEIGDEGRRQLDKFARAFEQLVPRIPADIDVVVQVQGHTDTDPVAQGGRFRDNWHLSSERALDVVAYLASRGIAERWLSAAGFGPHQPAVSGDDARAKGQNRRIEIRITRR